MSPKLLYRLGCPVFGARSWVGEVLPADTTPREKLRAYSALFLAVEGNGTFYGLPSPSTVRRWAEDTPETFRFAFKVPRSITHERALVGVTEELAAFLRRLEPLGPRLGPFMVQLPKALGRPVLDRLLAFLDLFPENVPLSVEVRHVDWFDGGRNERDLHRGLSARSAERVCLDSRALFSAPATDPATRSAQARKPRVPARFVGLGPTPLVRFIGRNDPGECAPFLDDWAKVVAAWIAEGRTPLVFCHAPDERFAPQLARSFHERLRVRCPALGALPDFPLRSAGPGQLSLF